MFGLTEPAAATHVNVKYRSCWAGGFQGTIKVYYEGRSYQPRRIRSIYYRIRKGDNRGGNSANVYWHDYAVAPAKHIYSGDDAIQDGRFHYLGGWYYRGSGTASMYFIFDKSWASDPRCGKVVFG